MSTNECPVTAKKSKIQNVFAVNTVDTFVQYSPCPQWEIKIKFPAFHIWTFKCP